MIEVQSDNHDYDEPREPDVQRVTLSHHHRGELRSKQEYHEPGQSGWRISPIPWRMMIPEESGFSESGAGASASSSSHQYPDHSSKRRHSGEDWQHASVFNKRPRLDDIDRKISMAGKEYREMI